MDVTAGALIGLALGAGLSVVGGLLWRAARIRDQLREHTLSRGWTWVPPSGHVVLSVEGQHQGLPWRVETRASHDDSQSATQFEAPAETPAVVMLGPKVPALLRRIPLSDPRVQKLLYLLVGEDARLLADGRFLPLDGELGEKVDVLTTDEAVARRLLTPPVCDVLHAWIAEEQAPVITWWRGQLVVRPRWIVSRPHQLDRLVRMGTRLMEAS